MSLEPLLKHAKESFNEGNISNALEDLEFAKEINSRDFRIFFYYGRCYIKKGEFEKAIENLERAYRLNSVAHIAFYLAKVYNLNGNYLDAIDLINNTIKLGISDKVRAGLNYFKAGAYLELGNRDKAINAAQRAVEFAPDNEEYQSALKYLKNT